MSEYIKATVLEAGILQYLPELTTFASGKPANNKLDLERLFAKREEVPDDETWAHIGKARGLLLGAMMIEAWQFKPDALWGIPNGGQKCARINAELARLPFIELEKDVEASEPGQKRFRITPAGLAMMKRHKVHRAVGMEDVTNELTSVEGVLCVDELAETTVGIVGGWRRGDPALERPVNGLPVRWAVEQPIPNILIPDHPFFQEYGHYGVGTLAADRE